MERIAAICYHQILRIVFSVSEYAVITVESIAVVLLTIGLVRAALYLIKTLTATRRFIDILSNTTSAKKISELVDNFDSPGTVRIITDSLNQTAFTLGWLHPQIYLGSALINKTDRNSLDIVIRHELGHVRRRDPLVQMILTALADILWFVPVIPRLLRRYKLASEIACDKLAVLGGHETFEVARVLTTLAGNPACSIHPPKPAISSISDNLEIRVRSLLGENPAHFMKIPAKIIFASVLIVSSIFLSSSALLAAKYDPSGNLASIRATADLCENGHTQSDFLESLGIKCPHCGSDVYQEDMSQEVTDSTPACHEKL